MTVALIVGGAECVWDDLKRARELCTQLGLSYIHFVCNDMIEQYPEEAHGCTLHPDKLENWLKRRQEHKHARLFSIWAHRHYRYATDDMPDWGGSVGLFATKVALVKYQHKKIVLCGVPMEKTAGHFVRRKPWFHYSGFQHGWNNHMKEIKDYVRSSGGWTAEKLGNPTPEWLTSGEP